MQEYDCRCCELVDPDLIEEQRQADEAAEVLALQMQQEFERSLRLIGHDPAKKAD